MASFHDDAVVPTAAPDRIRRALRSRSTARVRRQTFRADYATRALALRLTAGVLAVALTGACFLRFGFGVHGLLAGSFVCVLTLLSVIDVEQRRLPNRIVLPSAAAMLAAQIALYPERAFEWVLAAAGAALLLLLPLLFFPAGMGMGDVKLALLLGGALGAPVVTALLLAMVSAGVFAVTLVAREGPQARRRTIAFGPFLAAGAIATLFIG